ncbi:MAG: hypothetical protein AAYR31_00555 [Candidatus Vidania fulgoroideorum]
MKFKIKKTVKSIINYNKNNIITISANKNIKKKKIIEFFKKIIKIKKVNSLTKKNNKIYFIKKNDKEI